MRRIGVFVGLFGVLGVFLGGGERAFGANDRTAISADEMARIPVVDIAPLDLETIG